MDIQTESTELMELWRRLDHNAGSRIGVLSSTFPITGCGVGVKTSQTEQKFRTVQASVRRIKTELSYDSLNNGNVNILNLSRWIA